MKRLLLIAAFIALVCASADAPAQLFSKKPKVDPTRRVPELILIVKTDTDERKRAAAAEELEPNSSAALLVWEDIWARDLLQALKNAGAELFDYGRIPHEVVTAAREYATQNA